MSADPAELPELTWTEIRNHLFKYLRLDAEWVVEDGESLRWQPGVFPLTVSTVDQGEFEDGSEHVWRRVRAHTLIMEATEEQGAALTERFRPLYPFGSIFWDDGYLIASTCMQLNNLSRDMLGMLHTSILSQATAVAILAKTLLDEVPEDEAEALTAAFQIGDDQLGIRDARDELLWIYDPSNHQEINDQLQTLGNQIIETWRDARPIYEGLMGNRMLPGFADDNVVFFQDKTGIAVGIGPVNDDSDAAVYGPGLSVLCLVNPLTAHPGPTFIDAANQHMALNARSHIGYANVAPSPEGSFCLNVSTFLPPGAIQPGNPERLAITVSNIASHVMAGAATLL